MPTATRKSLPGLNVALHADVEVRIDRLVDVRDEVEGACRFLVEQHDGGTAWRDMLLVAPGKRKWNERIAPALDAADVPFRMLLGHPGTKPGPGDVLHVTSMYGAEGLAFPVVVVMGLGDLPWKQQPLDEALRIVRSAVSVATRSIVVSCSNESALVERLARG